jgi:hypothetical protein
MFWPRWHKPVNDHEGCRHQLACFLPKYGFVQLNMIKRENREQPTPNPVQRFRGSLSHSVFHGRFLRSEDFLLQNGATLRHATRKLNR